MAELPKYKRGSFAGVNIPRVEYADLKEQSVGFSRAAELFDQMGGFLAKKAETQAIERGKQKVVDIGAEQYLKNIEAKGGATNVEERQGLQLANKFFSTQLQASAINDMNVFIADARQKKIPANDVKNHLESIVLSYSQSMQEYDIDAGLALQQQLMPSGLSKLNEYNRFINTDQINQLNQQTQNTSTVFLNETLQAIASTGIYDEDVLRQQLIDSGNSSEETESILIKNRPIFEQEQFMAGFDNLQTYQEKEAFAESYEFKYMLPSKQRSMIESQLRSAEYDLEDQQRTIKAELKDDVNIALALGGQLKHDYSDERLNNAFQNDPDGLEQIIEARDAAEKLLADIPGLNTMSVTDQDQLLLQYDQRARQTRNAVDVEAYEQLKKSITSNRKERANDFATHAIKSDSATGEMLIAGLENALNNKEDQGLLIAAFEGVNRHAALTSTPRDEVTYLPRDRAGVLVNAMTEIADNNVTVAVPLLNSLLDRAGSFRDDIVIELEEAGLSTDITVALRQKNPEQQAMILELRNQTAKSISEAQGGVVDTTSLTDAYKSYLEGTEPYRNALNMGGDVDQVNAVMTRYNKVAEKHIYHEMLVNGRSETDAIQVVLARLLPNAAIRTDKVEAIAPQGQEAMHDDALSSTLMFGLNDENIKDSLNIGIPEPLREKYMDALGSQKRARGAGSRTFNLDQAVFELFMRQIKQDGVWINNNTGDGYFLMRRVGLDSGSLVPVMNEDGKQVEVLWDNIGDFTQFIDLLPTPASDFRMRGQ